MPGLVGIDAAEELLKPKRGRPRSANPKEHVNIRLDADVVRAFKSTGKGWQTRLNDALAGLVEHAHAGALTAATRCVGRGADACPWSRGDLRHCQCLVDLTRQLSNSRAELQRLVDSDLSA